MKRNIKFAVLGIFILVIGTFAIRSFFVLSDYRPKGIDTKKGVSAVIAMNSADVNGIENEIRHKKAVYKAKQAESAAVSGGLKNLPEMFEDVLIAGDSLVEAIEVYNILPDKTVEAKVGASLKDLDESVDKLTAQNPQYIVFHYGCNQIGPKDSAEDFCDDYASIIKTVKKELPNAHIYVDSIFPVGKRAYKQNSYLKNIDYYNTYIRKMCKDTGVTFIDCDKIWDGIGTEYYDGDDIHPKYDFYTKKYLPYIAVLMGLDE